MNGVEWLVDGWGCSADSLQDRNILTALFDSLIADLHLRPIGPTVWHQFPGSGGITGLCLLSESHLACHTFPEHQSLCLNLFCCVPRQEWNFEAELASRLGAQQVHVRKFLRSYATLPEHASAMK